MALLVVVRLFVSDRSTMDEWLGESPGLAAAQVVLLEATLVGIAYLTAGKEVMSGMLRRASSRSIVLWAFISGVCLSVLLTELAHVLTTAAPEVFSPEVLVSIARRLARPSPGALGLLVALSAAAPIGEELLCRGVMLRSFETRLGAAGAILASSAIFGMLHFDAAQGSSALLFGLFAGWLVVRTGSLWPALAAHAGVNLTDSVSVYLGWVDASRVLAHGLPVWMVVAAIVGLGSAAFLIHSSRFVGTVERVISDPR